MIYGVGFNRLMTGGLDDLLGDRPHFASTRIFMNLHNVVYSRRSLNHGPRDKTASIENDVNLNWGALGKKLLPQPRELGDVPSVFVPLKISINEFQIRHS